MLEEMAIRPFSEKPSNARWQQWAAWVAASPAPRQMPRSVGFLVEEQLVGYEGTAATPKQEVSSNTAEHPFANSAVPISTTNYHARSKLDGEVFKLGWLRCRARYECYWSPLCRAFPAS